ncbi:MAG: aldose epimerase family protein [Bacteroidia bacterium]|nr:aldose epimerase family protein [Bacteroidia bacterium]
MSKFSMSAVLCALAVLSLSACQKAAPGELLDASAFETEIDGKPVSLYTITNGTITAQITNYAGYIVGIYAPDKDGNYANVVGHNDNIEQYKSFSRNPVGSALGRFANRIGNASFSIDGVEYQVTKNSGKHILHGGAHGFGNTVWDVEKVTRNKVVFSCLLEDGLDGFPGNLKTYLTFSITKDNGVSIDYKATTDKATVCNMSHHAYFNLEGMDAEDILDHVLMVNADNITESDRSLIPTGKLLPVDGTAYDFRKPVRIGDRQIAAPAGFGRPAPGTPAPVIPEGMVRSYDQNFCLNHSKADKVELVASLYSPKTGRLMEVLNNHPGMQLFTGNRKAVAMESQMYPDSPNHPEFPNTVLRPGETYHHNVIYRFSVK